MDKHSKEKINDKEAFEELAEELDEEQAEVMHYDHDHDVIHKTNNFLEMLANQPESIVRKFMIVLDEDEELKNKFGQFIKQEHYRLLQKRLSQCPSFLSLDEPTALKILRIPSSELGVLAIALRKLEMNFSDSEWIHVMKLASIESVLKT